VRRTDAAAISYHAHVLKNEAMMGIFRHADAGALAQAA